MKKINISKALIAIIAVATIVAACKVDRLDTNQIVETPDVVLTAYGPRPVVRGGVLRFVGSNLDQVASVTLQGCAPITDIIVIKAGVPSEIQITVPVEGPEPGDVILTTKDGKQITASTPLTYSEPIVFTSFSPASLYPGETLTIEGDYLYNIHEVIFTAKVKVSEADFITHTRHKIEVRVPAEAKSGVVGIGTIDETVTTEADLLKELNVIESEEDLDVKLAAGKLSANTVKAGETVTVTGTRLDLVTAVIVGFKEIEDFTATTGKITFILPADVPDGEVKLVHASGEVAQAGNLACVVPANLAVSPSKVKSGEVITISGDNLDLVNSIMLPGEVWPDFENAGTITLTVPAEAQEGDIELHMANGKSVSVAYALVGPAIASVAPNPVPAGEKIVVTGSDLDLVTEVILASDAVDFTLTGEGKLEIPVSASNLGGELALKTANGTVVTAPEEIVIDYGSKTVVNDVTAEVGPGGTITMTGSGFNWIESIYLGDYKVTSYSKREDGEMIFLVPEDITPGTYPLTFNLTGGEQESPAGKSVKFVDEEGPIVVTVWEGSAELGNWTGNVQLLVAELGSLYPGSKLNIHYTADGEYPQFKLCDINWTILPTFETVANEWGVVNVDPAANAYVYDLSDADISAIVNNEASWGGRGMVIAGQQATVTKVEVVILPAGKLEPVKDTDIILVDWDNHGGHDGYWDQPDSWGGVTTELVNKEEGNLFLRIVTGTTDQKWVVCCNHQSSYTENVPEWSIADVSKYVLKIDVLLEGGSAADMTFNPVIGDQWPGGQGAGLFPATTNGEWITVTIDLGLTGSWDCTSGTNGFMAENVPDGMCLDNFRFSLR